MKHSIVKNRVILMVLAVWIMMPLSAIAEEEFELEEIEVVASPIIERNLLDAFAGEKTLVSEAQIETLNVQDLTAALRKTPGINISRYNPIGSFGGGEGGAVFIRGIGSSRPGSEIKTYIDGIPMFMSIWNHPLMDLMPIDTTRSVEVYKSPQPQNFGNAMAALNMVPKIRVEEGVGSKATVAGGSFGTVVTSAESGGRFENFDYYLGGSYRHSDGHRDHAEGETGDMFARFGYTFNEHWDAYFFGLYSDNSAEDPGEEGADVSEREGTYETRTRLTSLTLSNSYAGARGYLKLFHNNGDGDWLDQPTSTDGVREDLFNDFTFYGIKAREIFNLPGETEVVAGLDWEYTDGDYKMYYSNGGTNPWPGHDFTTVSPYFAISRQFGSTDGLSISPSAGVRYYDHSDFGSAWSPHVGVVMGYGRFKGHAGYSRGVVFPGLDVVVFSEEVIPVLGDSWKSLDPEIMDHYEVGFSYGIGDIAGLEVVWFYNDGKDRYVFITSPTSPPVYGNVEAYVTKGVEVSADIHPTANLAFFLGGTYMQTDPSDTPYAPEVTLSAGLTWRFLRAFTFSADLQYSDEMFVNSQARRANAENIAEVDSYFVLNAKLSYAFKTKSEKISGKVFVAGENLTDADYEYRPGYPMPGLNGMAGVSISF